MKSYQSTLFLALIFSLCFCIPGCKDKKTALLDSMIKLNVYEAGNTYRDSGVSPQWRNYQEFIQTFSDSELVKLCDYKNAIVRTYAFRRLVERHHSNIYNILIKHLSDTNSLRSSVSSHEDSEESVGDIYLDLVGYTDDGSSFFGVPWRNLTQNQYEYIDSVLLFQDALSSRNSTGRLKYQSFETMLYRLKPTPAYHDRVAQLVNQEVYEALLLLASYKDPADTSVLKYLLSLDKKDELSPVLSNFTLTSTVRYAIIQFPHPCFYPIIKEKIIAEIGSDKIPDRDESYPLYLAIVRYPTIETKKLLEMSLKRFDAGHYNRSAYINDALQEYPSKLLEGLKVYITNTHL